MSPTMTFEQARKIVDLLDRRDGFMRYTALTSLAAPNGDVIWDQDLSRRFYELVCEQIARIDAQLTELGVDMSNAQPANVRERLRLALSGG